MNARVSAELSGVGVGGKGGGEKYGAGGNAGLDVVKSSVESAPSEAASSRVYPRFCGSVAGRSRQLALRSVEPRPEPRSEEAQQSASATATDRVTMLGGMKGGAVALIGGIGLGVKGGAAALIGGIGLGEPDGALLGGIGG